MKKVLLSLLAFVSIVGLLSLTSCKKEEAGNGQFTATMESCTSQDGKTVLNGTNLNWVSGDQIAIYGIGGNGVYSAAPQSNATMATFSRVSGRDVTAPCRAYYPTTLTTDGISVTLPATQTYVEGSMVNFPMYAESNTNMLSFHNLCGALKLHLTKANTSITSVAVTANSQINGTFTLNYNNGDPVLLGSSTATTSAPSTTVLTCATAQAIDNGADFFIYLPAGNYIGLEIELNSNDGRYCIKTANIAIPVVRSQYTTISLGENDLTFTSPLPQGALPGLFSVSATQQVRFSQGNLQYQASTDTWRFALHQYDTLDAHNCNIGNYNYTGWIDLFGWGTGNNPTLSSGNSSDYGTFVDWGVNAISNGGNTANQWRTLSITEWQYLFSHHRFGIGNINGTGGIIVLPPNWVSPTGVPSFSDGYSSDPHDYTHNNYTLAQWAMMEESGALFLPAAGSRGGSYFWPFDGQYWSSTPNGDDRASHWEFCGWNNRPGSTGRIYGLSVRLVQDN